MPKSKKMSREDATGLVELVRTAERYFRHPDVEAILGYQDSARISMNLEEVAGYIEDNVLDEEGEGLTAKDRKTAASALRTAASKLEIPPVSVIPFALSSRAMAARLRDAAARIARKS
jgi:hypothetical protein